ncbi:hypothetical protein KFU94_51805 [Chloroflexi bacterium TSY]|nr:hypothetical protein [Chloroflexi bacterium TSY]
MTHNPIFSCCLLNLLRQGYELYGDEALFYVATQGKQGRAPTCRAKAFTASGYIIFRSDWGDGPEPYEDARYLGFDCGPLGVGKHRVHMYANINQALSKLSI